jgi:hypothetical protein
MSTPNPVPGSKKKKLGFLEKHVCKSEAHKLAESLHKAAKQNYKAAVADYEHDSAELANLLDVRLKGKLPDTEIAKLKDEYDTAVRLHAIGARPKDPDAAAALYRDNAAELKAISRKAMEALKKRAASPTGSDDELQRQRRAWYALENTRRELRQSAERGTALLRMAIADRPDSADENALAAADEALVHLATAEERAKAGSLGHAASDVKAAAALVAKVTARLGEIQAAPTKSFAMWQALDVPGMLDKLAETRNFDDAASTELVKSLEDVLECAKRGECSRALKTAEWPKQVFEAAAQKFADARKEVEKRGDLPTLAKKMGELCESMSVALLEHKQDAVAQKAKRIVTAGEFKAADGAAAQHRWLKALEWLRKGDEELAEIRAAWRKLTGDAAKKRVQARNDPNETAVANGIGIDAYCEKLALAESVVTKNGFDPYALATPMKPEEVAGIYGYTTEDYNTLNPLRRDKQPDGMTDADWAAAKVNYAQYSASLEAGLTKLPGYTGEVFRGGALPESIVESIKKTKTFSDPAFVSSSYSHGFAGDYQFLITAKGRSGKDISSFSIYKETEGEVLFLPATKFKVTAIQEGKPEEAPPHKLLKPGKLYIFMEEI